LFDSAVAVVDLYDGAMRTTRGIGPNPIDRAPGGACVEGECHERAFLGQYRFLSNALILLD